MNLFSGVITKMQSECQNPIQYYLTQENNFLHINQLINKNISIEHTGFQCLSCNKEKKIYRQDLCNNCFFDSPTAGQRIMNPELSTAHLDIEDRDLDYEKLVQLQPHIVYFAVSSNLKVGVTRKSQIPTRWIDQGATQAIEIVEVPNRYLAGITEVALKNHFADKTNWRKMLQNQAEIVNLLHEKEKVFNLLPDEVKPYFLQNNNITDLHFPVEQYPSKINSLNLEKTPFYNGTLKGIKGQYLIFEDQTVFNVRNHEGFKINIKL